MSHGFRAREGRPLQHRPRTNAATTSVQRPELYGTPEAKDYASAAIHLNNETLIIAGEEHMGIQKPLFGGIIITRESIGKAFCNNYNESQRLHIQYKTISHKALCEVRDEPLGLIFLTLDDFLGNSTEDYASFDNRELCTLVKENLKTSLEREMPWLIEHSKKIINDYYGIPSNKLPIKLNFRFDDGKYGSPQSPSNRMIGGLLLNGFLQELECYTELLADSFCEDIGVICQVLAPNGMPTNKKWAQIDIGISFVGKRLFQETLEEACIRQARTIRAQVHPDVIKLARDDANKLYYSSNDPFSYEGQVFYIWEVLYPDQITFIDEEPLDTSFCKCKERQSAIEFSSNN